jgi:hypothetical protein
MLQHEAGSSRNVAHYARLSLVKEAIVGAVVQEFGFWSEAASCPRRRSVLAVTKGNPNNGKL